MPSAVSPAMTPSRPGEYGRSSVGAVAVAVGAAADGELVMRRMVSGSTAPRRRPIGPPGRALRHPRPGPGHRSRRASDTMARARTITTQPTDQATNSAGGGLAAKIGFSGAGQAGP